jgi:putative FmdB family regulatory protein
MPTYEYRCDACTHQFDQFQSIKAGPLRKCPACGKSRLKRLIGTGGAIIFKGSGFYETDYRSESYKQGAKADQGAAGATKNNGSDNGSNGNGKAKADSAAKTETAKADTAPKQADPKPAAAAK